MVTFLAYPVYSPEDFLAVDSFENWAW